MTTQILPDCRIAFASTPDERERIFRFRYRIYVQEMGKQPSYADHVNSRLCDDMDNDAAAIGYAAAGDEIIATIRWNQGTAKTIPERWKKIYALDRFSRYAPEALGFSSRLMLAPAWRGSMVLNALLASLFRRGREAGALFDFINCAPSLIELYEQLGYRRYTDGFVDEDVGYRVPLVLVLDDVEHMRAVHSPFMRLPVPIASDPAIPAWFREEFTGQLGIVNRRLVDAGEFWRSLEEKLRRAPTEAIPLFEGLSTEEAHRFLKSGVILKCRAGDAILRRGDVGNEMFVVLSGLVEVRQGVTGRHAALALMGPGQLFGEMAFLSQRPRTADVVAVEDVEVLVLNQSFLKRAIKRSPDITARVLLNLSLVLCDRLRVSTINWVELLGAGAPEPVTEPPATAAVDAGSYAFGAFSQNEVELARLQKQARTAAGLETAMLEKAGLRHGMRVLDLACGPGVITTLLARLCQPGLVTGLDISPDLIKEARLLVDAQGLGNIELQEGNVYTLDLAEGEYDFVYARFLFQHLEKPALALKNILKVLKPGGILCVTDVDDHWLTLYPEPEGFAEFTRLAAEGQRKRGGDRFVGRKLGWYFAEAGFDKVETAVQMVSSRDIGMKSFLDITTGFKREQVTEADPEAMQKTLAGFYDLANNPNSWGFVGVYVTTGVRPELPTN